MRKRLLWLAPAMLVAGCMNGADAKKADDATAAFYAQVQAKQYQAIYEGASTDLKLSLPAGNFIAMMQQVDQIMGPCGSPKKRLSFHIDINQQGTFRSQGYTRACKGGPLNERVTIVIRNGEAKLAGYHFGPDADQTNGDD